MKPIPLAAMPNHRMHVDLFWPLKVTEGSKKYVCVITDAFTKYVELSAIPDKTAKTVGKEFANELLNSLCAELPDTDCPQVHDSLPSSNQRSG